MKARYLKVGPRIMCEAVRRELLRRGKIKADEVVAEVGQANAPVQEVYYITTRRRNTKQKR